MEIEKLKSAIESWISANRDLIEKHEMIEDGSFFDINITPKKSGASSVSISFSKDSLSSDISIGQFSQICNYKLASSNAFIQILDSVKNGQVTEVIYITLGMRAKVDGKLVVNDNILTDTGYVFPVEFLIKILKPKIQVVPYKSW